MLRLPIRMNLPAAVLATAAGSIFALATLAAAAGANERAEELDGAWKLISVETDGEVQQLDDDVRWRIKNDKVFYGGELLAAIAVYATSVPKGVDLAFQQPKRECEGVYAIEKDSLKVCINIRNTGPKERPAGFVTKNKPELRVFTFQCLSPDSVAEAGKGFVGMLLGKENDVLVIPTVIENSPAEKAGIRAGDALLSVGIQAVDDIETAVDLVRRERPGSELQLRVRRAGSVKDITVKVGVFPFSLLVPLD
jgi:uncharacterized protein (TIGR03067 family)